MDEKIINSTIARVIVSTKTKKRQFSLYEVAEDLAMLKQEMGSMEAVSKAIGISSGMLNQFLSIYKLPAEVIELVKNRRIDSVSIVHYLAKFEKSDAIELASLLLNKKLSNQDLRALVPYRKQYPNDPIAELVSRINTSKNIKVSVIRVSITDFQKSSEEVVKELSFLIGSENFLTIEFQKDNVDIKITTAGEQKLRANAKKMGKTFQELISQLIK